MSLESTRPDERAVCDRLPDPGPTPDSALDSLLIHAEVQRAIDGLPEHQRQALILSRRRTCLLWKWLKRWASRWARSKSQRIHHARRNLLRRLDPRHPRRPWLGKEESNAGK